MDESRGFTANLINSISLHLKMEVDVVKFLVVMVAAMTILAPRVAKPAEPVAVISLPMVYKQRGLKAMKNLPVYVDQDCGKYFRTVATDGKY